MATPEVTKEQVKKVQQLWPVNDKKEPLHIDSATNMALAFLSSSNTDELKKKLLEASLHSDVMQVMLILSRELFKDEQNWQLLAEVTERIEKLMQQEFDLEIIKAYIRGEFGMRPLFAAMRLAISIDITKPKYAMTNESRYTLVPNEEEFNKLQEVALPLLFTTIKNYLINE